MIKQITTRTGKIFFDCEKTLEWLVVGDYGKEANIKADFLGLTKQIEGVEHQAVDMSQKMVVTISTQHGCKASCNFCDVPRVGYHGNATVDEMRDQIRHAIADTGVKHTKRLNIHFARMGEPTYNEQVLAIAKQIGAYPYFGDNEFTADVVHPVISTMCPKDRITLESYLQEWCKIKNEVFKGEAGLQLSINSTDDNQRDGMFRCKSCSLGHVSKIAERLPDPVGRKYTLNFAVTADSILNAKKLSKLFDRSKFIVKITPIHRTRQVLEYGYAVTTTYDDYDVYQKFEVPLLAEGWDVIVFVPSKEEDEDRITCGNALLYSGIPEHLKTKGKAKK